MWIQHNQCIYINYCDFLLQILPVADPSKGILYVLLLSEMACFIYLFIKFFSILLEKIFFIAWNKSLFFFPFCDFSEQTACHSSVFMVSDLPSVSLIYRVSCSGSVCSCAFITFVQMHCGSPAGVFRLLCLVKHLLCLLTAACSLSEVVCDIMQRWSFILLSTLSACSYLSLSLYLSHTSPSV